jgi:hypothetical protein
MIDRAPARAKPESRTAHQRWRTSRDATRSLAAAFLGEPLMLGRRRWQSDATVEVNFVEVGNSLALSLTDEVHVPNPLYEKGGLASEALSALGHQNFRRESATSASLTQNFDKVRYEASSEPAGYLTQNNWGGFGRLFCFMWSIYRSLTTGGMPVKASSVD